VSVYNLGNMAVMKGENSKLVAVEEEPGIGHRPGPVDSIVTVMIFRRGYLFANCMVIYTFDIDIHSNCTDIRSCSLWISTVFA